MFDGYEAHHLDALQNCSALMFCGRDNVSTIRVAHESMEHCYPYDDFMKECKWVFIFNITLIFIIGGLGNFLTLLAAPYAYYRYPKKFCFQWGSVTVLILHLSFCDLAYILIGLSGFLDIYINDGFTRSPDLCWYIAMLRHLICYADFLTLSFIAVIRLRGAKQLVDTGKPPEHNGSDFISALVCILAIWLISFVFISPIIFEIETGGLEWPKFGWIPGVAACNTFTCPSSNIQGINVISALGFFVPFFILMTVYLVFIPKYIFQYTSTYPAVYTENRQHLVNVRQVNTVLAMLAIAYMIFTAPLVILELLDITATEISNQSFLFVLGFNWYWWIYSINFIIYIARIKDFREMIKLFLQDMFIFLRLKKNIERPNQ